MDYNGSDMKTLFSRPRDFILPIFFLAFSLRMLHYLQSGENPMLNYPVLDESYYMDFGRRVASGLWIGEERAFFMDPLYGYFLGILFLLFGESLVPVRILQILLDSGSAVLVCSLGTRYWNRTAGITAGLLYAFYKVAFFYTLLLLKTTLTIHLSLLFIFALRPVMRGGRPAWWFLLGCMAGILVFVQADLLLFLPVTVVLYGWAEKPGWPVFLRHSLVFIGGALVILLLAGQRNYRVTGEFLLLNTQSGRLLYSSNRADNLTGRYNVPPFARAHPEESEADFHREAERRVGRSMSAGEVSRYWAGETWTFLKNHPEAVPVLWKNKMKGTLADYEIPVNHSYALASRFSAVTRWPMPTFALVFALGIPGLTVGLVGRRETVWLLLPVLTALCTVTLFYAASRFRMIAVPVLAIGAGIWADRVLTWGRSNQILKVGAVCLVSGGLFWGSIHLSQPMATGTEEFYLAKAYWSQGRYREAEKVALDGMERFPDQARFALLCGMVALSEKRYDEAIRYNHIALQKNPNEADAFHNLGLALMLTGKHEEAVHVLQRALSVVFNPRYLFSLGKAYEGAGNREGALQCYRIFLATSRGDDPYRGAASERAAALVRREGHIGDEKTP